MNESVLRQIQNIAKIYNVEKVDTLLMFDIVNLNGNVSSELIDEIERDGVIIYEKV